MGRVLLAALPEDELERYLAATEFRALTPKTVTDRDALRSVLRRVRSDGYALVEEELELGLRSIAVPVASRSGRVLAAMNSGVSAARMNRSGMVEQLLPALKEHARLLGQLIP
jgi:IclR family pca regulon transcriptional regulator